jgi:hypothetical protein
MKIIAHRGNLNGPNFLTENSPDQINLCISKGYDVEIDVWYIDENFYLGHDKPIYKISFSYLLERKEWLWIHCKNQDALYKFNNLGFNYFWHQQDEVTLTSQEFIWAYPDKHAKYYKNIVILDFSKHVDFNFYANRKIYGICVDYVEI